MAFFTIDHRCVFVNRAYADLVGHDAQSILGMHAREIVGDAAWSEIEPHSARAIATLQPVKYVRELAGEGSGKVLEVSLLPQVREGVAWGAAVLITDITHHRAAEAALRESEARLAKFFQASQEGIVFFENGRVTDVNDALLRLVGGTRDEAIGKSVLDYVAPEFRRLVASRIAARYEQPYEGAILRADGTTLPTEFHGLMMPFRGHNYRMSVIRDISARKEAERRVQFMAHHDPLTGLPNRVQLNERLDYAITLARRRKQSLAVAFIDLDDFKLINDRHGHAAGDALLREVAERLRALLRSSDIVARLGGDEFIAVATELGNHSALIEVLEKVLHGLARPVVFKDVSLRCSASIGVAAFPRDGQSPADLIAAADKALYAAKAAGKHTWRAYAAQGGS